MRCIATDPDQADIFNASQACLHVTRDIYFRVLEVLEDATYTTFQDFGNALMCLESFRRDQTP